MSIPVTRPTLRRKDFGGVLNCLVTDRIGPGQLGAELASLLARLLGARAGVCLSSYAACIDRALDVLEVVPGDWLAVSALAPSVYREVCGRRGIRVLLVDTDGRSPLPDAAALERLLGSGRASGGGAARSTVEAGGGSVRVAVPKGLVLHYTLGFVPESDDLLRLGIPVVEDVSHALGGTWNGGPCGSHGEVSLLSLQPDGIITAGEGGAVFVRDRKAGRRLSEIRGAFDRDQLLPDMNAALGLIQLKELERFLRTRREIAAVLHQAVSRSRHGALLAGVQASESPGPGAGAGSAGSSAGSGAVGVPFGLAVTVRGGVKEVCQYAAKQGVETRRAFTDACLTFHSDGPGGPGKPEDDGAPTDECSDAIGGGPQDAAPAGAYAGAHDGAPREEPPREDLPQEFPLQEFPRASELLLRSVLFPLYPALGRKDVQLIAKVLATLP